MLVMLVTCLLEAPSTTDFIGYSSKLDAGAGMMDEEGAVKG